jgi:hypothetical protein
MTRGRQLMVVLLVAAVTVACERVSTSGRSGGASVAPVLAAGPLSLRTRRRAVVGLTTFYQKRGDAGIDDRRAASALSAPTGGP